MSTTNGGLTAKQARFVEEYLVDLNATAAAKRAGPSERTAEQLGCRLVRNGKVPDGGAAGMAQRRGRSNGAISSFAIGLSFLMISAETARV